MYELFSLCILEDGAKADAASSEAAATPEPGAKWN